MIKDQKGRAIRPPQGGFSRTRQFTILVFILFSFSSLLYGQLRMKRICFLQAGQYLGSDGKTICCDSDHNGLNELIFATLFSTYVTEWMVWEYRPFNRYELVFADTGTFPLPPGITTGNFRPYDVGDIDQDSFTDLVGPNNDQTQDSMYNVVTTQESPNYYFYPESLSWWHRFAYNEVISQPFYFPPDLDRDGRREILFEGPWPAANQVVNYIFENIGNNQNALVFTDTTGPPPYAYTFGDFDLDERMEFVSSDLMSIGRVFIFENTGDDQYSLVWIDTVRIANGSDVFSGNDLDGDGKPEFFVGFYSYPSSTFYLYMWEATGNNIYQRYLIAQKTLTIGSLADWESKCGDIDGDGIEELVWSTGNAFFVYKAMGNNQFQQVWEWWQDHGSFQVLIVNIFDTNQNGYNEIVVGGSGKTSIFEVEAVKVLRPNGGETFYGNYQEQIRWQKFYPPRCNSLSMFYSLDNGRTYDTIITGIPGADSSYLWTVPDTASDSCKVKIIAHGPGWQFDESDGVFTITPSGIDEIASPSLAMTSIKISPNVIKSQALICFTLPNAQEISLKLYDITGKLVKVFCDGYRESGIYKINLKAKDYSSGIYFIRLQTEESKPTCLQGGRQIIERIMIIK
jgi:hypothetical protein